MLSIYLIGAILNAIILLLYSDIFVENVLNMYSKNLTFKENSSVETLFVIVFIFISLLSWLFTLPTIISFIKNKVS